MAQTMLLTSGISANHFLRNKNPLAQPKVHHLFLSGNSPVTLPSRRPSLAPLAIFKPKTKAAPKKVEKVKPKVEDGIFGTSGGIGFTKQNELFVGRVAMIGFAASLLGEALTGKGILAQLNLETGIPIYEAEPLLLFFILFTLLGAIGALGDRGKFVDDPPTGLEKAVIPPGKGVRSALGLKEQGPLFGFTKANELFVGRLAQLGIAFSLIGLLTSSSEAEVRRCAILSTWSRASTMASPSLLHSSASSFHCRFPSLAIRTSAPAPQRNLLKVSASGTVLVEKSEAEKVQRLKTAYLERIIPALKDEFKYINIHQVPKVQKIVVNCGIGDAAQNDKGLEAAMKDIALITGQKPVKTRARASIATFKIREDQPLGIAVTLRGDVMYSFLDRLINLALPRTRDFQGVSPSSFDGNGNYSIGVKDQSVFPEIRFDAIGKARGMDVCISTTAKTDDEGQRLLALMGMPFREGSSANTGGAIVRKKKLKSHHFDAKSKGKGKR